MAGLVQGYVRMPEQDQPRSWEAAPQPGGPASGRDAGTSRTDKSDAQLGHGDRESMVMGTQEEMIAAQDAWRDAKRAYDDEAAPYVGVAWLPTVPRPDRVEGLSRAACEKLTQLGEAEQAAAAAFCAQLSTPTDST